VAACAVMVVAMGLSAGFGYWVGKPGGLDIRKYFQSDEQATPDASESGQPGATQSQAEPLPDPSMPPPPPINQETGYRMSGYTARPVDLPFITRSEAMGRSIELDADGGLVYRDPETNEPLYQPVTITQWAIAAHTQYYLTGNDLWLDLARASAQKVLDAKTESDGAYYFPYSYEWVNLEPPEFNFQPPWYSAMAQGEALSIFTQLAQEFPDEPQWREAADHTFESFLQPVSASQPWATNIVDGFAWFEEYVDPDPFEVVNGHIFALIGIYEYALMTADQRAAQLFDAGATTALYSLPVIRVPGELSVYCAETERCVDGEWQHGSYHRIHIAQAELLEAITGDPLFGQWASAFISDVPDYGPWWVARLWPGSSQ
jgi:hypothetical protein